MIRPETKLTELANNADAYVELQVHPKDIGLLQKGQKVEFYGSNNTRIFEATVDKLNPILNTAGTLTTYCSIAKTHKNKLQAGTFVNASVSIEAQEVKGVSLVAAVKEGEDYFAYFVDGKLLVKNKLENVRIVDDFVMFDNLPTGQLVINGAYYIE